MIRPVEPAFLLVVGRIATLAGASGFGWVEAVAIGYDGTVVAAGAAADLEPLVSRATRRLRLGPEQVAIPALADAHLHLLDAALADERLDLVGLARPAALDRIARAHHALSDPDAWLEGDGWHPDAWGGWPDAEDLERVAPGRRAAFWAHDRHALWASERALAEAGVDAARGDPPGGAIRRRPDGRPTGVLHETAAPLVLRRIPVPSIERRVEAVARLVPRLVGAGIGAVHDPGPLSPEVGLDSVEAYRRLADADRLPLDVHVSVRTASLPAALDADLRSGGRLGPAGDARPQPGFGEARVGWLKLFADGSLGSRTAAMLEPFEPSRGEAPSSGRAGPADRGILQLEPGEIAELVRRAATGGLATQIHAIGDAAVRVALDAFEAAGMEPAAVALQPLERHRPPPRPLAAPTLPGDGVLRPRIEHIQLVDPVDLPRFARLGVVASVQPAHLGSDAATARAAWGERAARSYGYGSLARAGATLAFGTDAPVEPWDPWPGLEQAVTRRGPGWPLDVSALGIAEALDLATALRAATVGPAVAAGRIDRGRLVPGCRGDLIVVPAAAFREPVEPGGPLGTTRPDLVLIAGREAATR